MPDEFDFEELNSKFNKLSEVLDSIKAQNALNIGDTTRVLSNISSRLESISNSGNEDELKEILFDLRKGLDDRYSMVTFKFTELEDAFKNITKQSEDTLTMPQIKELFDIITTNLSVFSKQVMSQGDILNEITLRIESLRTDDTNKREVIKNIGFLKTDLEKFNNGFESIVFNINNNFENLLEKVSHLDPTSGVEDMKKALGNVSMTNNTIISAVQILDQKNNALENLANEIISQNTKINANVKALAGQSDFDGLVKKIENAIELITTLKGALTDSNDQSQRALLLQIDKFSSMVSKILTNEDFELFKKELSKIVYEVVEATNLLRGDLLGTNEEFKGLSELIDSLDLKVAFDKLNNKFDESQNNIKANVIEVITNSGIEPLKENINVLIQKIEHSKDTMFSSIDNNQSKVFEKFDELTKNLNVLNLALRNLPEILTQQYNAVSDKNSAYFEKNSHEIENIGFSMKTIQNNIYEMLPLLSENVSPDVREIKLMLSDVQKTISFTESLVRKTDSIENLINKVSAEYNVALKTVNSEIMSYMSGIKEDCESSDIKMNNFAFELNSLKSDFQRVLSELNIATNGQNEKYTQVCNKISSRLEDIVAAVSLDGGMPEGISLKVEFDRINQYMQDILLSVADIKIAGIPTKQEPVVQRENIKSDDILRIEDKLNKLKDQFSFVSTDIMENLYNRSELLLAEFKPIKNAILSFVDVDFQAVGAILKEQMSVYKSTMEKVISEVSTEEAQSVLNNLFTGLGSLDSKINNVAETLKQTQLDGLNEVKDLLQSATEVFVSKTSQSVTSASENNTINDFNDIVQPLLEKIEEKILEVKVDYKENFDRLTQHVSACADNVKLTVLPVFDEVKEKQNQIIGKLEDLPFVQNKLNELFEKLDKVQECITDYRQATLEGPISEEKIANLGEEEKNIITDFSRNMNELAGLVKASNENIDKKINSALANNQVNVDFEGLKNDIGQMMLSLQEKLSNVNFSANESTSTAQIKTVFDELKNEIVNDIKSINVIQPDEIEVVSKDIKVLNQKIDLIALNDDVKFEIEKSLSEIRDIVKDQQKLFHTINILETLATLDDINKMKGIEQLNRLNEVISVDKLNALNKLNLLDKLQNLDCLDELQNIPKIGGMIALQDQLKNIVVGLDQKLNLFSKNYSSLDLFTEDFKNEISSAKTAIMKHILTVFEQLSFVVEGEEIKDFVEEKSQEIIATINNDAVTQEIKSLKHAFNSMTPMEYSDIEEDIKKLDSLPEIKKLVNLIKCGTEEGNSGYTYSLTDVETDIAKLRLTLDDMKKVVENNSLREIADYVNDIVKSVDSMKFNISQDDIFKMKMDMERITSEVLSVSARTNKLLLTSDESKQLLDGSMLKFSELMSKIQNGFNQLEFSQITDKLNSMNNIIEENNKSQKNLTESVAKLSIWAENTEDNLLGISETMNRLKKSMTGDDALLDSLESKFSKQQQKIDSLEEKVEELISVIEANDSEQVTKKINNIDKQLTKLSKNIEKLTSYVEDEE